MPGQRSVASTARGRLGGGPLTDHLGSVAAITDDQGTLLDQQRYYLFGKERPNVGSITQTDFGYTGQRDLPSMGLMDYKATFYDSSIGRFIQPDTIIPNPADSQAWNRLSYVRNNPMRFTDPTGHYIVEDEDCTQLSCSGDPAHPKKLKDELGGQDSDSQLQDPFGNFGEVGCGSGDRSCLLGPMAPDVPSAPNWGKVASGVVLLLAVDGMIVAPIVLGALTGGIVFEAELIVTEGGWVLAFGGAILALNVYGVELILDGLRGE